MKILSLIAAFSILAVTATANESITLRYATFVFAGTHGQTENPDVDGMAMLRYNANSGWSRVQVILSGLRPNQTYGIQVGENLWEPYLIQTSANGRGHFTGEFATPPFGEPTILIFIHDGTSGAFNVSDAELRALAVPM